jgi:sarcosine oxidase subunit beta
MSPLARSAPAVVIGGGIVGASTAYHLARRGVAAVVLERGAGPLQASTRNAGGIRAQCRNTVERRLAMASIELWSDLAGSTAIDFEYHRGGNLRLATTAATLDALARESGEEAADGLVTEVLDRTELRRRAPYLSASFMGAKYCPGDGHANPILATWAMVAAARAAGARLVQGAEATRIEIDAGRVVAVHASIGGRPVRLSTGAVVHAAGPWTGELAAALGIEMPLVPARNAKFVTQATGHVHDPFVSSHELQVYLRQARAGHIHVGGVFTVDGTFDQRVSSAELRALARAADILPALRTMNVLRSWAGTLDLTPDHLPIVGAPRGIDGYLMAAGFSGHGFCLGPVVGRIMSDLVIDGRTGDDIAALHPDRFLPPAAAS